MTGAIVTETKFDVLKAREKAAKCSSQAREDGEECVSKDRSNEIRPKFYCQCSLEVYTWKHF